MDRITSRVTPRSPSQPNFIPSVPRRIPTTLVSRTVPSGRRGPCQDTHKYQSVIVITWVFSGYRPDSTVQNAGKSLKLQGFQLNPHGSPLTPSQVCYQAASQPVTSCKV